ncbi:hypothetical protein Tco_1085986 [Tanacetum coccineum]
MANLEFCDTHNMAPTYRNQQGDEFHQIVDFLNASQIRYALTANPTIYVSLIKLSWQTDTAKTLDNGEIEITATIDGTVKTVTEASVRRHLQLADADGQIVQGEGSTHPGSVVPQPRFPTHTHVEDKVVSFSENDRMVRAATTVSSLEAGQDIAGVPGCHVTIRDTPIHTRSEMVFTKPRDSPLPRVNTLGSDEGSMQHKELMELCTKLSKRVTSLEKEVNMTKQTYGAAYTTLITKVKKLEQKLKSRPSVSKRRRLVISSDEEDLVDEHPSKQGRKIAEIDQDEGITLQEVFSAAKDVTTTEKEVSTAARVSTAGAEFTTTSVVVSTASPTRFADVSAAKTLVYIRRSAEKDKGKSIMKESEQPRKIKKRVQVQMSLRLHEEEQAKFNEEQELLARERAEKEVNPLAIFNTVYKEVHTFVPMGTEVESERTKRAGQNLQQESSKRQKTSEASELVVEQKDKEADELSQEELQQMMIIVPKQGMNIIKVGNHTEIYQFFDDMLKAFDKDDLEKLSSLSGIHDLTWRLYDSCGVHHVSTKTGMDIYMLVEREYPLLRGTLTLMLVAKLLVEQDNEMSKELLRKIVMQAERPRR